MRAKFKSFGVIKKAVKMKRDKAFQTRLSRRYFFPGN
jgi:hypothetical protein